jgi:hypothetical protein
LYGGNNELQIILDVSLFGGFGMATLFLGADGPGNGQVVVPLMLKGIQVDREAASQCAALAKFPTGWKNLQDDS